MARLPLSADVPVSVAPTHPSARKPHTEVRTDLRLENSRLPFQRRTGCSGQRVPVGGWACTCEPDRAGLAPLRHFRDHVACSPAQAVCNGLAFIGPGGRWLGRRRSRVCSGPGRKLRGFSSVQDVRPSSHSAMQRRPAVPAAAPTRCASTPGHLAPRAKLVRALRPAGRDTGRHGRYKRHTGFLFRPQPRRNKPVRQGRTHTITIGPTQQRGGEA
jgi:hypothetical protein